MGNTQPSDLAQKECKPCQGDVPPLKGEELQKLADQLNDDWAVVEEHHLKREFSFKNFKQALDFVNRVGEVAEAEQHHPDLSLGWGYVNVELHTHKIDGLSEADFVFAAKVDELDAG